MIPKRKDPLNLNTFRKVSPNFPDESLQFFSIESMCSEKSISEGLLKKEMPDSQISNTKNKFSYESIKNLAKRPFQVRGPSDPSY